MRKYAFLIPISTIVSLCLLCALFGFTLLTTQVRQVQAAHYFQKGRQDTHQENIQKAVTVLVLDMSGSMGTNDPDGLRCSAANAFIDLSGANNYIGLIALDGDGDRGGTHQFQNAQSWADPAEMATPAQREALQTNLKTKSQSCQPHNSTPTYDALNRALNMLQQATEGKSVPGSVVLLTDGTPDPDTTEQINAIQNELLPQFKQHNWSIDTIALGTDSSIANGTSFHSFHEFLSGLANATSGKFYDDANGIIQGQPSPLNITPFFVDIFARHNQRTVGDDIGLTDLDGNKSRSFTVTGYTDNLDIIAVKDQPATTVSLQDPTGKTVDAQAGVFVSNTDPHYVVYSIDRPQEGSWTLTVNGSGKFLMKSLKTSSLRLAPIEITQTNLQVNEKSALAIGQPVTISTRLVSHGTQVTDKNITMNGHITYNGANGSYGQDFVFDSQSTPGTYTGTILVPENAPAGSYDITTTASTISQANTISSLLRSIRLAHFPQPYLLAPQTQQPTDKELTVPVHQWDPILQTMYSLPWAPVQWLSRWPLQNLSAQPSTILTGKTLLHQQLYKQGQVRADMLVPGEKSPVATQVINDKNGNFHLPLVAPKNGHYKLLFHTSGSFAESHGDFGTIERSIQLTSKPATWIQEAWAWLITLFYGLCILMTALLVRYYLLARPFGEVRLRQAGEAVGSIRFDRAHRNPLQGLLHPNILPSQAARIPEGLLFRFKRGAGIEVRPVGKKGMDWQQSDGSRLPSTFQEIHELRYMPKDDILAKEDVHTKDGVKTGNTEIEPMIYQLSDQSNTSSVLSEEFVMSTEDLGFSIPAKDNHYDEFDDERPARSLRKSWHTKPDRNKNLMKKITIYK